MLAALLLVLSLPAATAQVATLFTSPARGPNSRTTYYSGTLGTCDTEDWIDDTPWIAEGGGADGTKIWPVALNLDDFNDGAACGMCIAAVGTGSGSGGNPISTKKIRYGVVVDSCPSCNNPGSIDWRNTKGMDGDFGVKYYPVQCPTSGTHMSYKFEGSNQWYLKISVRNGRLPIKSLAIDLNGDGKFSPMKQTVGNFFEYQAPANGEGTVTIGKAFKLQITSALGATVIEPAVKPQFSGTSIVQNYVVQGTVQFRFKKRYRYANDPSNPLPTSKGASSLAK